MSLFDGLANKVTKCGHRVCVYMCALVRVHTHTHTHTFSLSRPLDLVLFSAGALTPRNSTEDSAVGAWCDLSVGLNRQTQMLELKTRVGRAIGKHGSVGNAVQNTHKVDVKYFADGTRRGVVYVTSDTRDLKACVAGIKRIQEVARASVPIGTLQLSHVRRCFEGM